MNYSTSRAKHYLRRLSERRGTAPFALRRLLQTAPLLFQTAAMDQVYGAEASSSAKTLCLLLAAALQFTPLLLAMFDEYYRGGSVSSSSDFDRSRKRKSSAAVMDHEVPSLEDIMDEENDFGVVSSSQHQFERSSVKSMCVWLSSVVINYGLLRALLDLFECKRNLKPAFVHKNHILLGCLVQGCLLLFLGGVVQRLQREGQFWFPARCTYFAVVYSAIFESAKGFPISLSKEHFLSSGGFILVCVAVVIFLIVAVIFQSHVNGLQASGGPRYVREWVKIFSLGAAVHAALVLAPGAGDFHLHHAYWGFLGVIALNPCTGSSRVSAIGASMFAGVWLHGLAAFGPEDLFDTTLPASHAASSCLRCNRWT